MHARKEQVSRTKPTEPIRKTIPSQIKSSTFKQHREEINYHRPMSIDECIDIINKTDLV